MNLGVKPSNIPFVVFSMLYILFLSFTYINMECELLYQLYKCIQ